MMGKLCILCGTELVDGNCANEHTFKKMCVNCEHCLVDGENGYICNNETNKLAVMNKMVEAAKAVSSAYKVENLVISPLPLKKPTNKCGEWTLSEEAKERVLNLFV